MALGVRFRHSLGDRLLEIPATSADRPFVLGRGSESDLVVPSMSVALQQCALFVYDGKWAVQEFTTGGTQLNGRQIDGPTLLHIGDVLTIGNEASAATLQIDPSGAAEGRTGNPAVEVAHPPEARSNTASVPNAQRTRPAQRSRPQTPDVVEETSLVEPDATESQPESMDETAAIAAEPVVEDPNEGVDWGLTAALAGATPRRGPRRKKPSSSGPLIVTILLGLIIVGVTAWIVTQKEQAPPQVVVVPEPAAPPPEAPVRSRTSIFSDGEKPVHPTAKSPDAQDDQPSAGTAKPDSAPAPSAPPDSTAAADDNTSDQSAPKADDPEWTGILAAHDGPDQAVALFRYDDYRRQHPGKNQKLLNQFEADALDLMWWQRIAQLCHRRAELATQLREEQKAIAEETEASFKAKLQAEQASLLVDQKSAEDTLHDEMGFTADQAPDVNDDQALATARKARDPEKFSEWSKHIAHYVRSHNGSLPWVNDNL